MNHKRLKVMVRAMLVAAGCSGVLFSSCTALVQVPGGSVDVSEGGVFVDFLGVTVEVTDARVLVDLPGVEVDVEGDFHHGHGF